MCCFAKYADGVAFIVTDAVCVPDSVDSILCADIVCNVGDDAAVDRCCEGCSDCVAMCVVPAVEVSVCRICLSHSTLKLSSASLVSFTCTNGNKYRITEPVPF